MSIIPTTTTATATTVMATKQIQKTSTNVAIRTHPHIDYAKLLEAGNYRAICNKQPMPSIPTLVFPANIGTDAASRMQYLIQNLPSTTGLSCEQSAVRFDILAGIATAHSYGDCIGYYYDEHFDTQAIGSELKPAIPYFEHMQAKTGLSVIDEYIITINTKSALATLRSISHVYHEQNAAAAEAQIALNMLPHLEIHIRDYFANNVKTVASESSIILTRRTNIFTSMSDYTYLMKRFETHAVETKAGLPHTYGVTNCIANSYPLTYLSSENYDKYATNIRQIVCNRVSNRSSKLAPELPLVIFDTPTNLEAPAVATTADALLQPIPIPVPVLTQLIRITKPEVPAPNVSPSNCAAQYSDASPITALSHCDRLSLALTTVYSYALTLLVAHPFDLTADGTAAITALLVEVNKKILQIKSYTIRKLVHELFNVAIFDEDSIIPQHFVLVCKNKPVSTSSTTPAPAYMYTYTPKYYTQNEYYDRAVDVAESFFYTFKVIKFYLHNIRVAFDGIAKLIMDARVVRYCEFSGTFAAIGAVFGAYYGFAALATLPAHNLNNEFTRFMLYNSPQSAQIKKSKFKRAPLRPSAVSTRVLDEDAKSKFVINYQNLYEIFHGIISR